MSKIVRIAIQNFKSISDLEMDFKGSTAIITGKNNSGKTSFLRGVVDRIRFIRPDVMVKQGEKEGRGELLLDTGEKFVWNFDIEGTDKLTYITDQGRKSVTKDLGAQFFPSVFDVDKFLLSSPKEQVKILQKLVGLDFTDVDKRYQLAYDVRTERNREAEIYHVKLEKMMKVDRVESVDVTSLLKKKDDEKLRLNSIYLDNRRVNEQTRKDWEEAKLKVDNEISKFNNQQDQNEVNFDKATQAANTLVELGFKDSGIMAAFLKDLFDSIKARKIASEFYPKQPTFIEEMPDRTELDKIDAQLLAASETNAQAQKWMDYQEYKAETEAARSKADEADALVKSIEDERQRMINSAKFPDGITITHDGVILVDGFPLDKNQISTSKLYCSALRIASMNLGEVKTLYFDASFLDKISLGEIQEWAHQNDLQLLIERPDWEGKEISYELIES